jgi:hypothetical protein
MQRFLALPEHLKGLFALLQAYDFVSFDSVGLHFYALIPFIHGGIVPCPYK